MFARSIAWMLIGLVLVTLVGACSETPSTPEGESAGANVVSPSEVEEAEYEAVQAPENPEITLAAPLVPDEVFRIQGEGSYVSAPFLLAGRGAIKVYWRQESSEFILMMVSTDDELAQAPMGKVTFEVALAPSEYVEDSPYVVPFEYVVGEYVFDITADGPWEVWAQVVYPEGE